MLKWYIGYFYYESNHNKADIFTVDSPKDATPENSGYDIVEGPFDTEEEAQENVT